MIGDSVLFALAYLCLAAAQSVWMLFIGRIFCGIACGITTIAAPTYVSEVSSPKIRGTLGSCFQLMVTIGVLYTVMIHEKTRKIVLRLILTIFFPTKNSLNCVDIRFDNF